MAFESLTDRLNGVFKKLRGKGKLNEADIKTAMRETVDNVINVLRTEFEQ